MENWHIYYLLRSCFTQNLNLHTLPFFKNLEINVREHFLSVLDTKKPSTSINRGFIMKENQVFTYSMAKDGLTYLYCKRKVLNDGISTTYLDI